jgi:hypothetical protein
LAGTTEARCDAAKGYCWCDDSGQCPCKVNRVLLIVAVKGWLWIYFLIIIQYDIFIHQITFLLNS